MPISQAKHPDPSEIAKELFNETNNITQSENENAGSEDNPNQNTRIYREEKLSELKGKADREPTSKKAFPVTASTFEFLSNHSGYIDKTDFILEFHHELPEVTCFLRPRRSGKSMALQMIKSFYQIPKIDLEAYYSNDLKHLDLKNTDKNLSKIDMEAENIGDHNPDTHVSARSKYPELKNPAESAFKQTRVNNPDVRAKFYKSVKKVEDPDFVKNNLGNWPVITLDFIDMDFVQPSSITLEEIIEEIASKVIKQAFKQYDYLLLLLMSQHASDIKYGSNTTEKCQQLSSDYGLMEIERMEDRISKLWRKFRKELPEDIQQFYRYYTGKITLLRDLNQAIPFLMEVLKDFYKKNVIVLVDEHDSPAQIIHGGISFEELADNKELIKSMEFLSEKMSILFGRIAKSNPNLHRFLMFGISDTVISFRQSGFNNLKTYQVLDTAYSQFFGINKEEISYIVEKVFEGIQSKDKEKVMVNIKDYYNGYYFEPGKELYSIYSTIQYLDESYVDYNRFQSIKKDGRWIPKPSSFWTKTSADETIKKILAMKFDYKFHIFLYNVFYGFSYYYKDYDPKIDKNFVSMLENPAGSVKRGKIAFYLFLNCGYLTPDDEKNSEQLEDAKDEKTYFKIPNKEIRDHF
jgi:hypothetical protein